MFGTDYPTPDGTCIRDYIHVDDLASAHVLALGAMDEPGACLAFNLGTGRGYSVREIVEACRRVTGREIPARGGRAAAGRSGRPLRRQLARSGASLAGAGQYDDAESIVATAWQWHARRWGVAVD